MCRRARVAEAHAKYTASGEYGSLAVYRLRGLFVRKLLLVSAVIAAGLGANARAATVSGTVFRDINANGLYGNTGPTAEPPIGGVTLNAIDELGNTTSVTSNATTGAYSITLPGNQLRIEAVTTIRLFPGASGFASPGPRTTVLFTTGNQTARDIGFSNPQQFCQDSPNVAANVYSNGNPNTTGTAGTNSWMVRGPFNFSPDNNPANATIVNGQIIGSTFGLVYQRSTDSLFAAAFLKRHSGLGIGDGNPVVAANTNTNETGAIYRIANPNAASPVASLLIDVQAFGINTGSVTRVENGATADFEAPPTVATSPNIDADAFDKVGKVGLGALTLSEDERTLWALNLNDRTVLQIPLTIAGGVPTAIGAGIVTHNVGASAAAPTCTNGVFRPFALKEMDGFVYVGGVCTAETSGTAADLRAAVLRLDPQAAPGTFTSVLNVPLNYPRGSASDDGVTPTNAAWRPWRATWGAIVAPAPGAATYGQTIQPQPILSDIEFDADGSMILSFIDRLSHQAGNGNYSPLAADGSPRATYEGAAGGDVLLACFSGGTWTLESAGGCGTRFSDATTGGQGPGNGEFFWHDKYQGATYPPDQTINVGGHREITLGGAAVHAVRREMVSSVFDPRTAFRAAGYRMFNLVDFDLTATNNAGETARSVEIFGQDAGGGLPVRFGKAAGIGNVEMMCSPPPIEIGNRVWLDSDRDGVQDPNEAPVANVAMTLYSATGAVLGRTTTSAAGEWYFTFSVGATDASTADNNVILPAPFFQNYFVAIDANNFASGQPLFARSRTTANADPSANGDARDSDGTPAAIPSVGTLTAFALSTGGPGANDHTIDFGFLSPDLGDLPDATAGTGANDYQTLIANGGPVHPVVPGLFLGTSVDGEADGQPSAGATGDDTNGGDDEDGITVGNLALTQNVAPVVNLTATNTTSSAARVCGFIDYNADGDFADAGESTSVAVPNGSINAAFVLNFGIVPTGSATASFARFRLSSDTAGACAATGVATDGEVEDYPVTIAANNDLGDLPDSGAGVGANNYETLNASGGPSHPIVAGLRLGATVDNEADGQPNAGATGDGADEDGITVANLSLTQNVAPVVNLTATNTTGTAARVCGFIDYNADGDFADAGESANVAVPTGSNNAPFVLNFGVVPTGSATASFARFRLSTDTAGACAPNGVASNGEVEDYAVTIGTNNDLGDLPDSGAGVGANNYETLNASGGPSHPIVAGLRLGATVDNEADGQPNAGATGDGADEDGITVANLSLTQNVAPVVNLTATNTTGSAARVCGFIDYNADGDFADAGESANVAVPTGSNNAPFVLNFGVVPTGSATASFARFRLSTDTAGACAPNGVATNGEVEDYAVTIASNNDLGDLPDTGVGVGANNYETLNASGGPSHPIVAGLRLGATVDNEADGQPSAGANGDGADEDGITVADLNLTVGVAPAVNLTATNTTGSAARACGFIDFNGDGDFADAGESANVAVPTGSNNAPFVLNFGAVPFGSATATFARFRLSTDTAGACAPNGAATNGEVEDYVAGVAAPSDLGDLPDTGPGTGAGNYETASANGGPRHPQRAGLRLGATIDTEADGQPSVGANGDGADEDGVTLADLAFVAGAPANVRVTVTNTTGTAARVCGFVDFNADGDFADASEATQVAVADGSNNATLTLAFGTVPANVAASSYARFRLSTATSACAATGAELDGEVEDYVTSGSSFDLGDLPDGAPGVGAGNYQTLLADGGARHPIVTGIQLGATIDAEADGQPNAGATGDGADEDGVTFPVAGFELGSPARAQIVASNSAGTPALVCGFIDWNGDGDFDDAAERAQGTVAAGAVNAALTLDFGTSPTSVAATIYSRFRISTDPACAPSGDATNGEVEDYVVPTTGNGALSLGDLVWEDSNNNGQVDGGEAGIAGIPVTLYRDDNQDCQADGAALATQPTTGTGGYLFTDLLPGNYIVEIQPPSTYLGSTGSGRYTPTGPFEPGPDPDNDVNNDDNGRNITPTVIRACTVQLTAKAEPTTDGDVDNNTNLSVDFGLVRNFDLALRKTLSPGQASVVRVGDTVSFTITVYNQGTIPATNVQITDYIPAGMALNDAAWTAIGLNNATRVIAGPIAPGGSSAVTIGLRITTPSTVGYRNLAEIDTAQDGTGGTPTDIDSIPDTDGGNDGPPTDDAIDNSNNDEDDADIATVTIATGVPANANWALIALIAAMLMIGMGRRRRVS